jgi:hypothetical protein
MHHLTNITLIKDKMDNKINLTTEQILAFRRLNERLGEFVKVALDDHMNYLRLSVDLTLGLVAGRSLDDLENLNRFSIGAAKRVKNEVNPDEVAYLRYIDFLAKHNISVISKLPPADSGLIKKERIDTIVEARGLKFEELALLNDEGDMVISAWNAARINRQRALQRVGAFLFIASQRPTGIYGDQKNRFEKEYNAAIQYLFSRASDFQNTELKFAVLLGGKAQSITKTDLMRDSFGPDMGIMQYLHPDERHPGRIVTAEQEAFIAKIREYGDSA